MSSSGSTSTALPPPAPTPPLRLANLDVPSNVTDPWVWCSTTLKGQMYPDFGTQFPARSAGLMAVLVLAILIASVYLAVTIRETKSRGRQVWFARVVPRPQGRYIIVNQYLTYPICSIILSLVWLGWAVYLYFMFEKNVHPHFLYLYLPLSYIPLFFHLSTTTITTLSGANLASRSSYSPDRHRLSPWAANSLYFVFVPMFVLCITVTGAVCASKWYQFTMNWERLYAALLQGEREWNGAWDQAIVDQVQILANNRQSSLEEWIRAVQGCAVVYCFFAVLLIILNLFGGLYLLFTLRSLDNSTSRMVPVPAGTPLVAPLQLLPYKPHGSPSSTPMDEKSGTDLTFDPSTTTQRAEAPWETQTFSPSGGDPTFDASARLKRLEWDVILFFISVVPSCLAFIAFCSWFGLRCFDIITTPDEFEFALTGFVWIYTVWSLLAMLAITLKTIFTSRRTSNKESSTYYAVHGTMSSCRDATTSKSAGGNPSFMIRGTSSHLVSSVGPLAGTEDELKVQENWLRRMEQCAFGSPSGIQVEVVVTSQVEGGTSDRL